MNSAEMYQKAYYLHYSASKYNEALILYKEIVEKFSYSQEAKHAKKQIANINKLPPEKLEKKDTEEQGSSANIILTTAPYLAGYEVVENIDIISAECAFGINLFKDLFTKMSDIFGGRSETIQKTLRDARKTCLNELRKEAFYLGADAVIAVKLDYNEFSGNNKSMLFLAASGTAVKIRKAEKKE